MMTKKSSQLKMLFKKMAIIPLVIGLLFLFANRVEAQQKTVVSKTETHKVHQEEVTPEMIKEYNSLAKEMNASKSGHFKLKKIDRIEFIHNLMTDEQKKGAEPFPNIPPPPPTVKSIKVKNTPPPPPIPANATEDQKKVYKNTIKKYKKSQKEVKNLPPLTPKVKSIKVTNAPPPPPIPAKATKKLKKAYKKAIKKYKKSQKEIKNIPPPLPKTTIDLFKKSYKLSLVKKSPVFPGCESTSQFEIRKCLSESFSLHFKENFNFKLAKKSIKHTDKTYISTSIIITKEGYISHISSYVLKMGRNKKITEEIKRVLNLVPQLKPGIRKGISVGVTYNIGIIFEKDKIKIESKPTAY